MAGPAQEVAGAPPAPEPGVTRRAEAVTVRPARRRPPARLLWAAAFTAAAIALFAAYIRLSATYPVNSDGANIVLMSWDMLHGNLLLHTWWMSDVSFYTTELPEYMLIDAIRGLSPDVTHIAAALTYTLVLVLTVLLAKSRATSRDGAARVLIAGGIMLAPQLGVGIFVLLLSVGHIGTAVPVLAVWLLLDRAPRRWYIPVSAAIILGWAMVADSLILVVAIVPLALVSVIGGIAGAILLLLTGEQTFRRLVPFLILFASGLLGVQDTVRSWLARRSGQTGETENEAFSIISVGIASIYGGYFGAGLGVITLAVLGLALHDTLTRLNAVKQFIAFFANIAAAAFFLFSGKVVWPAALVMMAGALIGGSLGGRMAGRIRPAVLRLIVVTAGVIISIMYFIG